MPCDICLPKLSLDYLMLCDSSREAQGRSLTVSGELWNRMDGEHLAVQTFQNSFPASMVKEWGSCSPEIYGGLKVVLLEIQLKRESMEWKKSSLKNKWQLWNATSADLPLKERLGEGECWTNLLLAVPAVGIWVPESRESWLSKEEDQSQVHGSRQQSWIWGDWSEVTYRI